MSFDLDISSYESDYMNQFENDEIEIDFDESLLDPKDNFSILPGIDDTDTMVQTQSNQITNDNKQTNSISNDNQQTNSNQFNDQQINSIQFNDQQTNSIQYNNQPCYLNPNSNQQQFTNPGYYVQQIFIIPYNNQQIVSQQNNLSYWRRRSPKRKIVLSDEADELKSRFYATFTTKKSFPKELIFEIHKKILSPQLGLPKMTRDERRQKDYYFQNYAFMKEKMLECLENNKQFILNTILKDIEKKVCN